MRDRVIRVTFNADVHSSIQWNFKPQQSEIYVSDGFALSLGQSRSRRAGGASGFASHLHVPRGLTAGIHPSAHAWAPVWGHTARAVPRGAPAVLTPELNFWSRMGMQRWCLPLPVVL